MTIPRSDLQSQIDELRAMVEQVYKPGASLAATVQNFTALAGAGGNGTQIAFTVANINQLASVSILRNVSRDPATATTLQAYTYLTLTAGEKITYSDNDPSIAGVQQFYWIRAASLATSQAPTLFGPIPFTPA